MDWGKYISENCRRPLHLNQMAADFGLSAESLRRRIRKQTGVPFKKLYLDAKIAEAVRLMILRPNTPLADIADAVGIDDPFYFSRLFRRYRGEPPSEYRRKLI